ncbi:MAG TPA: hypothetical protein VED17_05990 [Nitrososphaerales archaeon]|nr:hypothetical protein [Nitrososphaerales archaeon]
MSLERTRCPRHSSPTDSSSTNRFIPVTGTRTIQKVRRSKPNAPGDPGRKRFCFCSGRVWSNNNRVGRPVSCDFVELCRRSPAGTRDYPEIVVAFISTVTGFILHETGHKFIASSVGYAAHSKIWAIGITLTLVAAVLTSGAFIFGAPGVNLGLALFFLLLLLISPATGFTTVATYGFNLNVELGSSICCRSHR